MSSEGPTADELPSTKALKSAAWPRRALFGGHDEVEGDGEASGVDDGHPHWGEGEAEGHPHLGEGEAEGQAHSQVQCLGGRLVVSFGEGDREGLGGHIIVGVGECEGLAGDDADGEAEGDAGAEGEGEADSGGEGEADSGGEGDAEGEADSDGTGEADAEGDGDADSDGTGEADAEGEADSEGAGETDAEGDGDADSDGTGEGDSDFLGGHVDIGGEGDSDCLIMHDGEEEGEDLGLFELCHQPWSSPSLPARVGEACASKISSMRASSPTLAVS
jgi:hypothetical protein